MFKIGLCASVLVLALFAAGSARAEEAKPINLSLFTPIQIFPAETSIHGFRLSLLYGVNHEMHGVDLGLVNRATGSVDGFQWGAERASPLTNVIQNGNDNSASCFCEYCKARGKAHGIDAERARQGFENVLKYVPLSALKRHALDLN